jgi:hypothetical protein
MSFPSGMSITHSAGAALESAGMYTHFCRIRNERVTTVSSSNAYAHVVHQTNNQQEQGKGR